MSGELLKLGEYCGDTVRRRQAPGFLFTENRFEPGKVIPKHKHRLDHLTCVISGSFSERYEDRELECKKGCVLIVPAGLAHTDNIGQEGAHTLSLELSPRTSARINQSFTVFQAPAVLTSPQIRSCIGRVCSEFAAQEAASLLMLSALSYELLGLIERTLDRDTGPTWMEEAMRAIHAGARDGATASSVAKKIGIHEAHLSRVFKKINGCSVGDYVRFIRLESAKRDLIETEKTISEIAVEAGFYDLAHFSREFKKAFGITPSNYRKSV